MKTFHHPHRRRLLLYITFAFIPVGLYAKSELKPLTDYLDYVIANKDQFEEKKEEDIAVLRSLLSKKDASSEYIFEINLRLYDEYKKYRLDSAIHYALQNVRIAADLNDPVKVYLSQIDLASVYSYSGEFLECERILAGIDARDLPAQLKEEYFAARSRFYGHYAAVSNQKRYLREAEIYRDSLISILAPSSYDWRINMVNKYIGIGQIDQAEEMLLDLLEEVGDDTPELAVVTHYLGILRGIKGDPEGELKFCTMSAIADVKCSIKENASFQRLASIYYNKGDIARAYRYSQTAIEDAVFSGVQFRTAQMSQFYSIVNATHQAKEAKTNRKLKGFILLVSVLSVFLILLVLYVYKQIRRLSRVKEELSRTNTKLKEVNEELNEHNLNINDTNERLAESNQIKEQYIARFFNLCSAYIDKMEDFRKGVYKLAVNRQFDELIKRLRSTAAADMELEDLYKYFDSIFLSLYPTFVEDFNSLLEKEQRIKLKKGDLLNRELRIYALIRLGINNNVQISGFLRCSMSTVYNYRSKLRNNSVVGRDHFESMVMKIGNKVPNS